jgi:hypothetical protein
LGIEVPLQADGFPLQPFITGDGVDPDDRAGAPPDHWRTEAHWSWNFSNPSTGMAEHYLGVPMAHCALDVARGPDVKYVQFAADPAVLPPLLFDLAADPSQLQDLAGSGTAFELGWQASQRLTQWRMRSDERTLSGTMLTDDGPVESRDHWR